MKNRKTGMRRMTNYCVGCGMGAPEVRSNSPAPLCDICHQGRVLDDREKTIIKLRDGVGGEDSLLLREIGERFGLNRERVRLIENTALRKMERRIRHEKLGWEASRRRSFSPPSGCGTGRSDGEGGWGEKEGK